MNLTHAAMNSSWLIFFVALLILVSGVFTFLSFPSQEKPSITIREAVIYVSNPGLSAKRMEDLVSRPIEERVRQLPELKRVVSTVRSGSAILQVTLRDETAEMLPVWQRLRAKIDEVAPYLPEGTQPPLINDDFGRVVIASIAVTAPGFSMSEMREPLKTLREGIYRVPGVENVSIHGLQDERIYIQFDRARLAGLGLSVEAAVRQLQQQNVARSSGAVVLSGINSPVVTSGEIESLQALKNFTFSVPTARPGAEPASLRLGDIAQVQVLTPDPPESAAIYQGKDAVVLGVSMRAGQNIHTVGAALRAQVAELEQQLPAGFVLDYVTFQADVVKQEMGRMNQVMMETIAIVMVVVVLFLGWRAGVVVGCIVPLTILGTLLMMRTLSIELHNVSMAAIIIALGLLVDNGIVIVEDVERRLALGEERRHACIEAGRTLAIPLLTSSLVIIFAFSPFYFGDTATNEYMRPLEIVLALTLLGSWFFCLTAIPLLCSLFLRNNGHGQYDAEPHHRESRFYAAYSRLICTVLDHKLWFMLAMTTLLLAAIILLASLPAGFMPPSDRPQFQVALELHPGSDARRTKDVVRDLSHWLNDKNINPEVTTNIGYVADGGPRVILGLNPPLPASHIGYFTVSVAQTSDVDTLIARTQTWMTAQHPEVLTDVKRFSRGVNDAGTVAYRVSGPDEAVLREVGRQIQEVLRSMPGMVMVRDNWGPRVPRVDVQVDQAKAQRLGVSSQDIAATLSTRYSGSVVSILRDNDTLVPMIMRGSEVERTRPEDLVNTLVYPMSGTVPVPLSAVATLSLGSEPSSIRRRDLVRTLTVEGRSMIATAQQTVTEAAPAIADIALPPGYRIELGAEIEEAAEAQLPLQTYLPQAILGMLLLFIWQFRSFRKTALICISIPFAMIGVGPALMIAGEPLSFMALFGILSLAGIIVNNAVLLLDRIKTELASGKSQRNAAVAAAVARLRPIVMTKLTCISGLVPLLLFAGNLWTGMAVAIMGGLLLGTLITLGLIPVLYEILFNERLSGWIQNRFIAKEASFPSRLPCKE